MVVGGGRYMVFLSRSCLSLSRPLHPTGRSTATAGDHPPGAGDRAYPTAFRGTTSPPVLVLLRFGKRLLPLRVILPKRMEEGPCNTAGCPATIKGLRAMILRLSCLWRNL